MTALIKHPLLAAMMFVTAYFTTITVKANAQDTVVTGDAVQVREGAGSLITGTITDVNDRYFDMDSNGKTMRVMLYDVGLKADADDVFTAGMNVTVRGEFSGEEFGRTIVRADNVVASTGPTTTLMEGGLRR